MQPADPRILTINGGSSTIKLALFEAGDALRSILGGAVERIGRPEASLRVKGIDQADTFSRPVAAVRNNRSMDTSMSFTPAAGVPMATRSGDLDPGLFGYLARTEGMDAKKFTEMVNFESGLIGVSETSSDMRDLLGRETLDVRAAEAVSLFCYQVKKWIGGFAAALGGLDTLVFAGGIGENAPEVRARICEGLDFLGIGLETARNAGNEGVISVPAGAVVVRVIHTDEERVIAELVCDVLGLVSAKEH